MIHLPRFWKTVACAFIGAGVLGRFALLPFSLEYDETFTAVTSNPALSLGWILSHWLLVDVHPPLYNAWMWCYNHWVPFPDEVWLRLPSLAFSLLEVAAGWIFFPRRLGRTARLVFTALLACSASNLLYASQARSYSLLLLGSVLLTFSAVNILHFLKHGKITPVKNIAAFCAAGLLTGYTHYFGVSLFCAYFLLLAAFSWRLKRKPWNLFAGACLVFGAFCAWMLPNLWQNLQAGRFSGVWWGVGLGADVFILDIFLFIFSGFDAATAAGLFGVFLLWFWSRPKRKKRARARAAEFGILTGAGILVLSAAVLISLRTFMLVSRYFIVCLPALYLMFSLAVAPLLIKRAWPGWLLTAYLAANLFGFWNLWRIRTFEQPADAKQFIQYFMANYRHKKLFVLLVEGFPKEVTPFMMGFYWREYYKQEGEVQILTQLTREQVAALTDGKDDFVLWLPYCPGMNLDALGEQIGRKVYIKAKVGASCEMTFTAPS